MTDSEKLDMFETAREVLDLAVEQVISEERAKDENPRHIEWWRRRAREALQVWANPSIYDEEWRVAYLPFGNRIVANFTSALERV